MQPKGLSQIFGKIKSNSFKTKPKTIRKSADGEDIIHDLYFIPVISSKHSSIATETCKMFVPALLKGLGTFHVDNLCICIQGILVFDSFSGCHHHPSI